MTSSDVFVSEVVHKTYIKVNEQGTEAAAATGGIISITSIEGSGPNEMICNKPFFYMIVHKPSNTVLFLGRIMHVAGDGVTGTVGTYRKEQASTGNANTAASYCRCRFLFIMPLLLIVGNVFRF